MKQQTQIKDREQLREKQAPEQSENDSRCRVGTRKDMYIVQRKSNAIYTTSK